MVVLGKFLAAVCIAGLIVLALWQLNHDSPALPDAASGLLLLGTGVVIGMRIGYQSAARFIRDAVRMNKVLLDMNCDLVELNGWLMKQVLARHAGSVKSGHSSEHKVEADETN